MDTPDRKLRNRTLTASAALAVVAAAFALRDGTAHAEPITVMLCDGETSLTVAALGAEPTADEGKAIADQLMSDWLKKNPRAKWEDDVRTRHRFTPVADNRDLLGADVPTQEGTYSRVSELDVVTWARETEKFVAEGALVFHDAKRLGSTIAVSCDMCHPDASNTHAETYPKFQVQLGRVALLRDMINWCLEHPVRAKKLAEDSHEMRVLEAYMTAQRKGVPLNFGRR
jgi:thiosulfate dehydrogenase